MSVEILLGIIIFLLIFIAYVVWDFWQVYKDLTIKQLNISREQEKSLERYYYRWYDKIK